MEDESDSSSVEPEHVSQRKCKNKLCAMAGNPKRNGFCCCSCELFDDDRGKFIRLWQTGTKFTDVFTKSRRKALWKECTEHDHLCTGSSTVCKQWMREVEHQKEVLVEMGWFETN